MVTRTSVKDGLWSAADTWDSVVPENNDVVVIAAGHTVEFNADQTLFADGINGITITGTLKLTRTAGLYYMKVKAAKTIAGAGTFDCGTSGSPIPFAAKHTITGGAAWYIKGSDGLTMTVYAAEPAIKTVMLSGAEGVGDTVLEVDTDITTDIWADGDAIRIDNVNKGANSEARVIAAGGRAAGAITISEGLTATKIAGTVISLITRHVQFIGVGAAGHIAQNFASGKLTIAGGQWMTAPYRAFNASDVAISGGAFSGNTNVLYDCTGTISGGVFSGNTVPVIYSGVTISGGSFSGNTYAVQGAKSTAALTLAGGSFKGNTVVVNNGEGCTVSGGTHSGNGSFISGGQGNTVTGGTISNNTYGLIQTAGATVYGGAFSGHLRALSTVSAIMKNASFTGNSTDVYSSIVTCYNVLLGGTTENSNYNSLLSREAYSESFDHDQVAGAFKAWTRGGITTKQTTTKPTGKTFSMQTALESASAEGFWQKEITVSAGASVSISLNLRKDASMTYLPRIITFNKATTDPFAGGAGLDTFTMTDSVDTWEADSYTYTNTGSEDVTLVIRCQGMNATGNMYSLVEVEQINVDLTTALANIATIDAVVDAIKVKTDQLAFTVANQVDANALTGGTSAVSIRQEMDSNSTQLAAIKLKTDNLPSDPADESLLEAEVNAVAADVWAYGARTLTQTAAQVAAVLSGSTITATRGDTLSASLTGLGDISARTKLWFTVKADVEQADTAATILLEETAGLTVLNGATYATTANGSITVTDAVTGALTIALAAAVTQYLQAGPYQYDIQMLTASGVTTLTYGMFTVDASPDVTRTVS